MSMEFPIPRWAVNAFKGVLGVAVGAAIHASFVAPEEDERATPVVVSGEGVVKVDVIEAVSNAGSGAWFSLVQTACFLTNFSTPNDDAQGRENPYKVDQNFEQSTETAQNPSVHLRQPERCQK